MLHAIKNLDDLSMKKIDQLLIKQTKLSIHTLVFTLSISKSGYSNFLVSYFIWLYSLDYNLSNALAPC